MGTCLLYTPLRPGDTIEARSGLQTPLHHPSPSLCLWALFSLL